MHVPPMTENEFDASVGRLIEAAVKDCKGQKRAAAGVLLITAFRLAAEYDGQIDLAALAADYIEDVMKEATA